MGKRTFLDIGLRGDLIESTAKESRSHEVEGDGRFCGHRFILKTHLFGDKRCVYCGRWFGWTETDCLKAMQEGYVDYHNRDNVIEPLHCGSSHCVEYHHLSQKAVEERMELTEQRMTRLFTKLKKSGVVR